MPAALDDVTVVQDEDLVGVGDRAEPVGDDQDGAPARQLGQPVLHGGLRFGVGESGGLVEDQDRGVGEQRAGDAHPLRLPAGQQRVLPHHRAVTPWQGENPLVHGRRLGRSHHGFVTRVRVGQRDVLPHRSPQQHHVLEQEPDVPVQLGARQGADVGPTQPDLAAGDVVEAREQQPERGLPRAGRADQRGDGAGREHRVDAVQHLVAVGVTETDVGELDGERPGRHGRGPLGHRLRGLVQQRVHPPRRGHRATALVAGRVDRRQQLE